MRIVKKILPVVLAVSISLSLSGCVCVRNERFEELSQEEKQESLEILDEVKEDITDAFPVHSLSDKLILNFLTGMEELIQK